MDLRQMRHFVAVAEELHFGRAARRLNMAQPPLSQSIKRLEGELGVRLFDRSRRGVALTEAGAVCLEEARRTLMQAELTRTVTKRAASAESAKLSIAFIGPAMFRTLPPILANYRAKHPNVVTRLVEMSSPNQVKAILDGSVDVGVIRPTDALPEGGDRFIIERCPFVVAVPADSRFAGRSSIRLPELADEPCIQSPSSESPPEADSFIAACRAAGFMPRITLEAIQTGTKLSLVAAGFGWTFVMSTAQLAGRSNVVFIPIADVPSSLRWELAMVWRPQHMTPAVRSFVELTKAFVGDHPEMVAFDLPTEPQPLRSEPRRGKPTRSRAKAQASRRAAPAAR